MTTRFEFPEGATPISDCSGLIPTWVHNLNDLNRVEAENIMNAQRKYFRAPVNDPKNWFQVDELKNIHRAMFGEVWEWAGMYRQSVTSVGIKPILIPAKLAELCHEVLYWFQYPVELTFVEMAARIHHRVVFIHPFENGNGRFSRLVADRFLLALRCAYPIWPDHLNKDSGTRKDYISTLKNADKGNYEPLVDYMKSLGASNVHLSELLRDRFYLPYIQGKRGISAIKAMLRSGEKPNDETSNGHRSLQLAIKLGLEDVVRLLVEAGAEIAVADRSGLTPYATAILKGNKTIANFLRSKGAPDQVPSNMHQQYYMMYQRFPLSFG